MSETINYYDSKIVADTFSGDTSGVSGLPLPTSNVQTFQGPGTPVATGGPFTWVKPIGGNMVLIECWGGGGASGSPATAGGGGGGGYTSNIFPISIFPGPAVVNVGAGGTTPTNPATESNVFTSPGVKIIAGPYGAGGGPTTSGGGGGGVAGPGGPGVTAGAQGGGTGGPAPTTINGTIFGGGGGGLGPNGAGGTSVYGGGGGGGGVAGTGGTSVFGGPGGPSTAPRSGVIPGGGGGGPGGIGASGQVRITVF